ncbi:hypothetical protein IAQ61_011962 [Plenodomus lingam]|uniref:uncharacterized protein n=1 Tax=Leptosphaeria maculans TaxID=5022 RepID=UPI00332A7AA3|nr:hypothetical protein IAQ61_011962 [Plenodomus lingam]
MTSRRQRERSNRHDHIDDIHPRSMTLATDQPSALVDASHRRLYRTSCSPTVPQEDYVCLRRKLTVSSSRVSPSTAHILNSTIQSPAVA